MFRLSQAVRMILTLKCEQAGRLASQSLDRRLSWSERLALEGHRLVCHSCRQFKTQLRRLSRLAKQLGQKELHELELGPELSEQRKEKLKQSLR